jgi:anti-anti-sigma factor
LEFVCTLRDDGAHAAYVHVAGELDFTTAPQLEETLRWGERRAWLVALDLADVTSIDVAAIHVIAYASSHARQAGRRLVVLHGRSHFDRVLGSGGASDLVEFVDLDPDLSSLAALSLQGGGDLAS